MVKVKVPATSANLGVGYDCLGLAFDTFATISFEEIEEGLEIIGCQEAYCNDSNLIYQAFLKGLNAVDERVSGLRIIVDSNIPYARGLGSSAMCIIAGLMGASAMFQKTLNKYEIFKLATQMEGHPDNIAPALFGGLCVSFMEDDTPNMIRFGVKKDLLFVTIIPNYEVNTKKARDVLPTSMTYQEAVYQIGRCTALAKAIEIGNGLIIRKSCKDQMQEPYRKQLIPQYEEIKKLCFHYDMITTYISGSGSTMISLTQEEETAQAVIKELKKRYPEWDIRLLHATYDGATYEVK